MKPKILIVDDDLTTTTSVAKRLSLKDFDAVSLNDPEACLEELRRTKYNLVLLDIMMPGISGMELLRKIRKEYSGTELPIIMLTFLEDSNLIVEALSEGANDYILKPPRIEIVEARIKSQLRIVQLAKDNAQKKELEAIHAMIATYNHEINNPLAIAYGYISKVEKIYSGDMKDVQKIKEALERITKIVKSIEGVTESSEVSYDALEDRPKMIKVS